MPTIWPACLRASLRGAAAVTLLLIAASLLAVACGPDPTPTPLPTPTPTATPTPTPVPPTPTPTPMPEHVPTGSVEDLVITDSTTVGDIMAVFSAEEVSCLRDAIGAPLFDSIQGIPIATAPPGTLDSLPFECLGPENLIGVQIALMSAETGGLSAETRSCIREVAMENPGLLGGAEPSSPDEVSALIGAGIQMQLCLSDEEAARFAGESGGELPPPAVMRCLEEQLGGLEDFLAIFSGAEQDPEKLLGMFAAAQACGLEMTPDSADAPAGAVSE